MNFAFVALDRQGQEQRGQLEGASPAEIAVLLRARGLFPMEIDARAPAAASQAGSAGILPRRRRWGLGRDRIFFCRQLSLMLKTGLGLLEALRVLETSPLHARLVRMAGDWGRDVAQGHPLSQAMQASAGIFPPLAARLVRAAEASGELERAFSRIADHLENRAEIKTKLVSSLLYPVVLLAVSAGVIAFLVAKVLPQFAKFLTARAVPLPASTRFLLGAGEFLRDFGPAIFALLAALGIGLWIWYQKDAGRRALDRAFLRLPVLGPIFRTGILAEGSRTLSSLLQGGLPLQESLRLTGEVSGHSTFRDALEAASQRVLEGAALASSLEGSVFPPLFVQVLRVGEETGALDQVLGEVSGFYAEELKSRIRTLSTLFEPTLLIVVGSIVGTVYLSFFQAIFQLAQGR